MNHQSLNYLTWVMKKGEVGLTGREQGGIAKTGEGYQQKCWQFSKQY